MTPSPLSHRGIIIPRPPDQAEPLQRGIEELGGKAFLLPVIKITPPTCSEPIHTALSQLSVYDFLIVLSRNACCFIADELKSYWQALEKKPIVISIGQGTAHSLNQLGMTTDYCPVISSSEGLLKLPLLQHLETQSVLIFSGPRGRGILEKELRQRQARVTLIETYNRQPLWPRSEEITAVFSHHPDTVIITSVEVLEQLIAITQKAGQAILSLSIVALSDRIARQALLLGFKHIEVTSDPSVTSILCTLKKMGKIYGK
jgi:uroporphyrinogen-III synthase